MTTTPESDPLKRVDPAPEAPPCPACGSRLTLDRLHEVLAHLRHKRDAKHGSPIGGWSVTLGGGGGAGGGGGGLVSLNFPAASRLSPGATGGTGGQATQGNHVAASPSGRVEVQAGGIRHISDGRSTCAHCGTVFDPLVSVQRDVLLEEIKKLRLETSSAIDLLGELASEQN